MVWPIKSSARLIQIKSDETEGVLYISAVFDDRIERDIVYEGMFYSQLDESSVGLVVTKVDTITPGELKQPGHAQAAARLYEDCGADDAFLRDMYKRGNRLYIHYTEDGGEYIVLAKRQAFGESRPDNTGNI